MFINHFEYFFIYWGRVAKMTTQTAFGKNYWRAILIWLLTALVTFAVNTVTQQPKPLDALLTGGLVGVGVVAVVWLIFFPSIPPKMHGPITSIKAIGAHYENLTKFVDSGEAIITEGNLTDNTLDDWKQEVLSYLKIVNLHHSWKDKFMDVSEFNQRRLLSRITTKQMFVPATAEDDRLEVMKCHLLNLRKMRDDCYDYIMKLHAKEIG